AAPAHARVGPIDDDRRAEGWIEVFTEPHAYLVGSDREHSIPCRVRSQQDSMRETDARKEEHQADGKEGGCQQTPPDGDEARLGMHGSDSVFFQTFFLLFLCIRCSVTLPAGSVPQASLVMIRFFLSLPGSMSF